MSVDNENNARSSDGRRNNSHWGGTRRGVNRYREQGPRDRARNPTPEPNTRKRSDNPRKENNYVDYVGKKTHLAKNCRNWFTCGSSTHIKRNCSWKKRMEQTNVIRMCSIYRFEKSDSSKRTLLLAINDRSIGRTLN